MEETLKLARFCADLRARDLPREVVEKAKLCLIDYVANVYGSLRLEAVTRVVAYVRSLGGSEQASALGCGFRTGIHNAAFLNGTTAEAVEAQDGLRFGGNHPGTAVISAALAVAEISGAGGAKVLEAIVAGYETAGRIAAAMHPHHTLAGFLPTGTCGTFGAAAAASKLMGHGEEGILSSLGNAGFLAPLSMAEHLMGGFSVKIVQGGQAASSGLTAAALTGAEITGAPYVLEGSELGGGFTQITSRSEPNLSKIAEALGERFSILDIYFKPYTACRHTHGAAQAALELKREAQLAPRDIRAVEVHTYGIAAMAVGKAVTPASTFVTAQFSIPYVVAACLIDGAMGPSQLQAGRIADPSLIELSRKVAVHADSELSNLYPDFTATRIEVTLEDGRTIAKRIDIPKGDPRDPMTREDVAGKLSRFASGRDEGAIQRIVTTAMNLEEVRDIREWTSLV